MKNSQDARYEVLRESAGCVGEDLFPVEVETASELEIQGRWFAGDFGRDFVTTDGHPVRIVQFGVWNRERGPDFAECAVAIGDEEVRRGDIEIDGDARDWERHDHATNPDYENVVLHVFTKGGVEAFARTPLHRAIPQVRLDLGSPGKARASGQPLAIPGRCVAPLRLAGEERVLGILEAAGRFRAEEKGRRIARWSEIHGPDGALFYALAECLGYKSNKLPFLLMAQRLTLAFLRKQGDDAEALLFGCAGFLPAKELEVSPDTHDYLRTLWEGWWKWRGECERLVLSGKSWRMGGQRPMNHPQRRIGALAVLLKRWNRLRKAIERADVDAVRDVLGGLTHEYWQHHYTLTSKRTPQPMALVGAERVDAILANVVFPLALRRGEEVWEAFRNWVAPGDSQKLRVAGVRLFGGVERSRAMLKRVVCQQGLLQIYEDFCRRDATNCSVCRFPEQMQTWSDQQT